MHDRPQPQHTRELAHHTRTQRRKLLGSHSRDGRKRSKSSRRCHVSEGHGGAAYHYHADTLVREPGRLRALPFGAFGRFWRPVAAVRGGDVVCVGEGAAGRGMRMGGASNVKVAYLLNTGFSGLSPGFTATRHTQLSDTTTSFGVRGSSSVARALWGACVAAEHGALKARASSVRRASRASAGGGGCWRLSLVHRSYTALTPLEPISSRAAAVLPAVSAAERRACEQAFRLVRVRVRVSKPSAWAM